MALGTFMRGCELGFAAACSNRTSMTLGRPLRHDAPGIQDYPIILEGAKGPIKDRDPAALYARACEQGWPGTCTPARERAQRSL
jgi:hypothetical protein